MSIRGSKVKEVNKQMVYFSSKPKVFYNNSNIVRMLKMQQRAIKISSLCSEVD